MTRRKRDLKHGGWLPYLEKLGIEVRRAQEWMREAGWVENGKSAANDDDAHLPSRVASGVDKRPRKAVTIDRAVTDLIRDLGVPASDLSTGSTGSRPGRAKGERT